MVHRNLTKCTTITKKAAFAYTNLTNAQLFKKTQKMQISRGLGTPPQPPTQDLWRFAFCAFFETVVQLARLVYANSAFFVTVVHVLTFLFIGYRLCRRPLGLRNGRFDAWMLVFLVVIWHSRASGSTNLRAKGKEGGQEVRIEKYPVDPCWGQVLPL